MHLSLERYLAALADRRRSPHTLRAVRLDLTRFAAWWEATRRRRFDPALLCPTDLLDWRQARQVDDGAAPATINRALASLHGYATWALAAGLLVEDPTLEVRPVPATPLAPRGLPPEATDALLRAAGQEPHSTLRARDEAVLALLVYAGLRVQEVCDVQLRDLDLAGGTITVRRGKAGTARRVPLHPEAQRLIRRYLERVRCLAGLPAVGDAAEREPLVAGIAVAAVGRPLRPGLDQRQVQRRLRHLGQQAATQLRAEAARTSDLCRAEELADLAERLARATPHQLRHGLARRLLTTGASLPEVQRVLGHSRLETTARYLMPSEDDLRLAINRAGVAPPGRPAP